MAAVPPRSRARLRGRPRASGGLRMMEAVPGLLRLGATIALRTTEFGVATGVRVGTRMIQGAAAGESPADLIQEATIDVRDRIREFLGVVDPAAAEAEAAGDQNGRLDDRSV